MNLSGRTVLVTGAGGGIGRHITDALARRGARLLLHDRDQALLDRIPHDGVRLVADLADLAQAEDLVARATAAAGRLDVLVNNAGVEYVGAYTDQTRAEIEDVIAVNVLAPMVLIRAVLPAMVERRDGHIVNVTSVAGMGPAPFLASYGTSKAALLELTRSLRVELRGSGVGLSAISPGFVADDGMYARMHEESGVRAPIVLGTVSPERVGEAVADAIEREVAERIVATRPMRPLFGLSGLLPRAGDAAIVASGARRFLLRVGRARGRA